MSKKLEFFLEKNLTRTLRRSLLEKLARTSNSFSMKVFPELQVGTRIPDLVCVLHDQQHAERVHLSEYESWVLAEVVLSGPTSAEHISERLFSNVERTKRALTRMSRAGLLKSDTIGLYYVKSLKVAPNVEVVSVEAKLRNWKEALCQAQQYLHFSNRSYIALPRSVVLRHPEILKKCKILGIGLITVSHQGSEILFRPKPISPSSHQWIWVVSKTVGLLKK